MGGVEAPAELLPGHLDHADDDDDDDGDGGNGDDDDDGDDNLLVWNILSCSEYIFGAISV